MKMGATFWFILSLAVSPCLSDPLRILVVFGMPSKSHTILGEGIVRPLLAAGHEVTYITVQPYKNPPPNLREVDVSSNYEIMPPNKLNLTLILNKELLTNDMNIIKTMMLKNSAHTFGNENVQKLINDPKERFDLVIAEWMFTDLPSAFATIFDSPLIWFTPVEVTSEIIGLIDAMPNPAYSTALLTYTTPPYSFVTRVQNVWDRLTEKFRNYMYYDDLESKEFDKFVKPVLTKKGRIAPKYEEARYNASLILGNSHVSMGAAASLPQSYKPIGGYHISENVQPLSEDLKKIMDKSKNGVIYFSMGSNLKSKDWPEDIIIRLLKMFGGLSQTVLWKFEEVLPNLPKNVHILKWAPQPSILSHPNCVLFISHGGLLSTIETIHYGVPIIGIPVFGDQPLNVLRSVSKGFAKKVELSYNLVDDLKAAIDELISNPKYNEKVKELSFIYHHRPIKPAAELVHWVEHVASTRGAPHLRSPALDVPLYQRLYIDLAIILIAAIILAIILLKRVCRKIYPSSKVGNKKKKN